MSYVIHIWEQPLPTSLRHADELVGTLMRAPKTTEVNNKFAEAAKRLTGKYPFNEDPTIDVDGEVWSAIEPEAALDPDPTSICMRAVL
jgi:hypothetical protein